VKRLKNIRDPYNPWSISGVLDGVSVELDSGICLNQIEKMKQKKYYNRFINTKDYFATNKSKVSINELSNVSEWVDDSVVLDEIQLKYRYMNIWKDTSKHIGIVAGGNWETGPSSDCYVESLNSQKETIGFRYVLRVTRKN